MQLIQYVPTLEMLIFNLITIDRCCQRKYSAWKTALILSIFSAVMFILFLKLDPTVPFKGNGSLSLVGFVYLIPFRYLYKEELPLLSIIVCTCWVYTLGILSLSIQMGSIVGSGSYLPILLAANILFLVSLYPFYAWVVPKYIFIIENLKDFEKSWYKYIALNTSLNFLLLVVINNVFLLGSPSVLKVLALSLLLASTYVCYFIIYKIVQDALKMRRLERDVSYDSLTGLGNRTQLWNHLHDLIEENRTFSVLFMDLDKFKQINDVHGHIIGDQYLCHFSDMIASLFRGCGKSYRFGGDEFVAVYYGIVPQHVLDQLRECPEWDLDAPCPFNGVSIGTLLCQPPHNSAEQILQQVDHAMYQAKFQKDS